MTSYISYHDYLQKDGFTVINNLFRKEEIAAILELIKAADASRSTFRKTDDLFAIRQVLKEIPGLTKLIWNKEIQAVVRNLFGADYFIVKSIYFDKPPSSNWSVAWHQDLTISVDKKMAIEGFGPWTVKQNQFAVQPPLPLLESNYTIRIHLDDTDENNGALQVIPGSHAIGVCRPETINRGNTSIKTCNIPAGGIMIMRPLLLHASGRTVNEQRRRVLHIEFSNQQLPEGLSWSERLVCSW